MTTPLMLEMASEIRIKTRRLRRQMTSFPGRTRYLRLLVPLAMLAILATGCLSAEAVYSLQKVNVSRDASGIPPVYEHSTLSAKAQSWAETLAARGRLSHSNISSGVGPGWSTLGENLSQATSVDSAHSIFLSSSSHRNTMLNGAYSHIGVGIAYAGPHIYVVHVYGG